MPAQRDSQRSKVYRSERVLRQFANPLPTITDIEKFITKEMSRKRIIDKYPDAVRSIVVADGRGRRRACAYGGRQISMPKWSRNTHIVIHEVAHIISARHYGHQIAGHGWEYCSVYLDLVRHIMGVEAFETLKQSFKDHKVKFSEPKKRKPLSPEMRAALAERLKAARAAKA
jgi:putative metallohydrolase (TIGR04338 family)